MIGFWIASQVSGFLVSVCVSRHYVYWWSGSSSDVWTVSECWNIRCAGIWTVAQFSGYLKVRILVLRQKLKYLGVLTLTSVSSVQKDIGVWILGFQMYRYYFKCTDFTSGVRYLDLNSGLQILDVQLLGIRLGIWMSVCLDTSSNVKILSVWNFICLDSWILAVWVPGH